MKKPAQRQTKAALGVLPGLLNATLRVNIEQNESKNKFDKKRAPY